MRQFAIVVLLLVGAGSVFGQDVGPPNVVMIIGDDHGFPYFGFTGSPYVITPNLDLLAQEGALFKLGHTTDNHCRPALQTLMTGLYPIQYAARAESLRVRDAQADAAYEGLSLDERGHWDFMHRSHVMRQFGTLPKLLAEAGYVSFQAGKWWEQSYETGGFTDGMSTGWAESRTGQPGFFRELMGGEGIALARETMQPVFDFIDRNSDTSFFLWYAPSLPHTPLDPPYTYYKYYANSNLSESAKEYYGNCTWFDAGVGDLLDHLQERDLTDNTLVIYVNDNGWEQPPFAEYKGRPILYANGGPNGKLALHDQAFRTPVILRWPGVIAPQTFDDVLVSTVDLMPTILDYAGVAVPDGLPGSSLRPLIEGLADWPRDALVGHVTQMRSDTDVMGRRQDGYYVRTRRWHFTWTDDHARLFDMTADPLRDVSTDYPELLPGFMAQIESWKRGFTLPDPTTR